MGRPSARVFDVAVSDANNFYAVSCPSRVGVTQVTITGHFTPGADSDFSAGIYTRKFTDAAVDIERMYASQTVAGKVVAKLKSAATFRENDLVTIAGTSVAGYNGTAIKVLSTTVVPGQPAEVLLDLAYTAESFGGTIALNISSSYHPNYEFIPMMACDTDGVWRFVDSHGLPFVNQDPRGLDNADRQAMYFKFDKTGNYRVTIVTITDWF